MSLVFKTDNLTKHYKKVTALWGVNLHVEKGDIYGLIGSNGAGKTTLMKMAAGIGFPSKGRMELFGSTDLSRQRKRISVLLDNMEPFPTMTVKENMILLQKSLGIPEADTVEYLMNQVGLTAQASKKVSTLSRGNCKKLSIAMALMGNPDFLILDEPMNGLDPQGMVEMRELFLFLKEDLHMTILLSSHILGELGKMATRYGIMKQGKLIEESSAEELSSRCRQYLDIGVDEMERAVSFLEERGYISQYEVMPERKLRIYDAESEPAFLNRLLNEQGINVFHLEVHGQDLEQYFMERMGESYA